MRGEQLKAFWKQIKIGFWKRLIVCFALIFSVTLFNAFGYPIVKLAATIGMLITAELLVLCYFPFYVNQIGLIFRTKATERPLPDEIAALSREMGLKIRKMKTIPKMCNAYARGNQVFVGEELLNKLDLAQLKAVLAHEFGHIKGKHMTIQLLYMLPIAAYLSLNWHNLPPIMLNLGLFAYMIVAMIPIQWELERRADLTAAKYVGKEAIKSALLAIEDKDKLNEPSETHPPTSKRLKWLDKE